jgi:hypothetical protein
MVHVPNGVVLGGNARQRAIQMAALKRDGFKVGFPDLIIYNSDGRVAHIEVKAEAGRQSDKQKECQTQLENLGHHYAVCRSVDDVAESLEEWGWD